MNELIELRYKREYTGQPDSEDAALHEAMTWAVWLDPEGKYEVCEQYEEDEGGWSCNDIFDNEADAIGFIDSWFEQWGPVTLQ